jgi:hypothetical protein
MMTPRNPRSLLCLAPLLLAAVLACVALPCCGATPRNVATMTLATAGAVVQQLVDANEAAYDVARNQLRAEYQRGGMTRADYDRAIEPMDAEFTARAQACASASAALYAAALLTRDARAGADLSVYRQPAARVLRALELALDALGTSNTIDPVAVPAEIRATLAALRTLAAGAETTDGGDQ